MVRKGLGMLPATGVVMVDVDDEGGAAWVEVVERGASVAIERVRDCCEALKFVKRCFAGMAARLDAMLSMRCGGIGGFGLDSQIRDGMDLASLRGSSLLRRKLTGAAENTYIHQHISYILTHLNTE